MNEAIKTWMKKSRERLNHFKTNCRLNTSDTKNLKRPNFTIIKSKERISDDSAQ